MGSSNLTGDFLITGLQNNVNYDIEFRATTSAWAGVELRNVQLSGATSVGNVVMLPGAELSGTVTDSNGTPLNGVNMNVYDEDGEDIFTPNDGTNPLGQFAVTVPLGDLKLRAVPPTGAQMVPNQQEITVTANHNVGTIALEPGYLVTGTVIDAFNNLPVGGTDLTVFDTFTGMEMEWLKTSANTFGAFSKLLPLGLFTLEFEAPLANPHHAHVEHNVVVATATPLGAIRLESGIIVTGTVTGPAGPVLGADVDVLTSDGYKLFTPDDNTDTAGLFSVVVPPGSYTLRVDPEPGSGLVGTKIPLTVSATSNNAGIINLTAGIEVSGEVVGPTGTVGGADIDVIDLITGEALIVSGDHANAAGKFQMTVPPGDWGLRVDAPQGSGASFLTWDGANLHGPTRLSLPLGSKDIVVDASAIGVWTLPIGASVPLTISVFNQTNTIRQIRYEFAVRYASGAETPIISLPPTFLPPNVPLSLSSAVPIPPTIPIQQMGRTLDLVFRARAANTGAVLDEADVPFIAR